MGEKSRTLNPTSSIFANKNLVKKNKQGCQNTSLKGYLLDPPLK